MKTRYSLSQISLHWATLLMIILTYAAMLTRDYFPEDNQPLVRLLHFNFGICVWLLMWVRIFLRTRNTTPAITPPLPRWQIAASHAVHGVLYLLFLSLPVLGVLTLEFGGRDWVLFGWQVPQFISPDPSARRTVRTAHEFLANCGYYLIGLHALAAIYHHYFRKDDTFTRMLPGK
ncbi:cytochrome b [Rahnella laticis]|uniref:cytochrome b n=1 Tax=Rahnella laticis TaxID=2787622 RepID=UPI0018A2A8AF|nr:cytochrome b [Rahnella laticis]MBF7995785.1 cytochrome b [Rahnella laticis]